MNKLSKEQKDIVTQMVKCLLDGTAFSYVQPRCMGRTRMVALAERCVAIERKKKEQTGMFSIIDIKRAYMAGWDDGAHEADFGYSNHSQENKEWSFKQWVRFLSK